jgi:hypothetical protein
MGRQERRRKRPALVIAPAGYDIEAPVLPSPSRREVTLSEWQQALNRQLSPEDKPGKVDVDARQMHLPGPGIVLISPQSLSTIRSIQGGKFGYVVRLSIGTLTTVRELTAGALIWAIRYRIIDGYRGISYANPIDPAIGRWQRMPVKGTAIYVRGETAVVQVRNATGPVTDFNDVNASIIPAESNPIVDDEEFFEASSVVEAELAENTIAWGYDVDGGVDLGDTVEALSYSGAVLATYPAREGAVMATRTLQAFCRYVPVVGNPQIHWRWLRKK